MPRPIDPPRSPNTCVPASSIARAPDAPVTPSSENGRIENSANEEAFHRAQEAQETGLEDLHIDEEAARILSEPARNYIGEDANSGQRKEVARISKELVRTVNEVSAREQDAIAKVNDDIVRMIAGSTVGQGNWFQSLKNKLYGSFVNDRSEFVKFIGHFLDAGDKSMQAFRNPLIRMYEAIAPVARSFNSRFADRREALLNTLLPTANRLGYSLEDLAVVLGHYATARHAPERNAFLLQRWRDMLSEEMAKPARQQSISVKEDLVRKIRNLERFNNTDLSAYNEEVHGKLYHSGYTDWQARQTMDRILRETGVTREEAEAFANRLSAEFDFILQERARFGTVDPNTQFPGFTTYVPMLSRHIDGFHNFNGAGNDASPYNPGTYYAASGRSAAPDSAFVTLGQYAQRASTEIATRDFGLALRAMERHFQANGINTGLKSVDYKEFMRRSLSAGYEMGQAYHNAYNNGGFVATLPVRNADGTTTFEKRFFHFRPDEGVGPQYEHNGVSFDMSRLNMALSAGFKLAEPGPIIRSLGKATSFMGQLNTRFTPLFSPVSGTRDFMERGLNMVNRPVYAEDGRLIGGGELLSAYVANVGQGTTLLLRGMRGSLDPGTTEGGWWREFQDAGLMQKFAQRMHVSDAGLDSLLQRAQSGKSGLDNALSAVGFTKKGMNKVFNSMGNGKSIALRKIDQWNDYFQNIAAFTHYITLRKKGVSARQAAGDVLEMMNMSQRGSAAPFLQALAPFVVPTVQSGTAMLRSLGFGARSLKDIPKEGAKGYAAMFGAFIGYSALMPLVRDSMGVDEEGNSRFDALSLDEATRILPIGYGSDGEYIRFPIGFGFPQQGALLAVGLDRVSSGRMDISELAFEVFFAGMKNVAPGNWPAYNFGDHPAEYMMTMVTPQPFRPVAEIAMNLNYFGSEIYNADNADETTPRYMRGRTTTNRRYHQEAKFFNDTVGLDMEPEKYEQLERGYFTGILRGLTSLANMADDIYKGSSRPSVLDSVHPALASMGITSWLGKTPKPEQSLFYEAKRHYDKLIRQYNVDLAKPAGVQMTASAWKRQQLAQHTDLTPAQIDGFIAIFEAGNELRELGKQFNAQYKDSWMNMESSQQLRAAFDELDRQSQAVYNKALKNLEYYRY